MGANFRSAQLLVFLLASVFSWGVPPLVDGAAAAERIVIGTPSRGLFEFPAVVAIRKGFLKDEGLEADKVQMQPAIAIKIARPNLTDELGWHPAPGWNGVVLPA